MEGYERGEPPDVSVFLDGYNRLIPLIAEAGVAAVANPLINITLQGRHDSYPKRRGMTRVPEMLDAGVDVAFGHDCVMDPWYALGSADMHAEMSAMLVAPTSANEKYWLLCEAMLACIIGFKAVATNSPI